MIRVLLAEDSATVRYLLKKILDDEPDLEVVGIARNGKQVVEMAAELRPDIITMDIRMPIMNGFEATREIMANYPCPILVISSSINDDNLNITFNAIESGALDIVEKPAGEFTSDYELIGQKIVKKIRVLSEVKVFHHRFKHSAHPAVEKVIEKPSVTQYQVIGITSSTGGPQTLKAILSELPSNYRLPICIVQHITTGFGRGLVDWLANECSLTIKLAERGEELKKGTVYIAPDDYHMEIGARGIVLLNQKEQYKGLRPSGEYLFRSLADTFGEHSVGIILTGMGDDGVYGLKYLREKKGMTIGQDEQSSIVYGMPRVAMEQGAIKRQMNVDEIVQYLIHTHNISPN